jgi:hypothetical protein
MANRQKYLKYSRTTISTEEWKLEAIKIMKKYNPHITETYIFNQGFDQVFAVLMRQGQVRTPVIEKFIEERIKQANNTLLEMHELSALLPTSNVCNNHTQNVEKSGEKVRIYDEIEEKYHEIPIENYNPSIHKKVSVNE